MPLWPFRTGNDARFQCSADDRLSTDESIYDAVRRNVPRSSYEVELQNYVQWRWRRGILQSIMPTTFYSAVAGFCFGFRQSRVEGRYIGRYRVLWRYTSTFAAMGLITSAVHHFLIMRSGYEDKMFYPIIASTVGSVILTVGAQMGSVGKGLFIGAFVGVFYTAACYATSYLHRRHMRNFFQQQQLLQIPVHKVSPELQHVYRAFLYDYRPLEEHDRRRRESLAISHDDDDSRLDAQTFLQNMTPEVCAWVNFPEWWPLKFYVQSEEEEMMKERMHNEEMERRSVLYLTTQDGDMLKRKMRTKQYRDL